MGKQKYSTESNVTSVNGSPVKGGREHYSHAKADARVGKRRTEADARQREYDGMSIPARITRATARPGESKRELARLGLQKKAWDADVSARKAAIKAGK